MGYLNKFVLIVGLFGMGISTALYAVEALSSDELAEHCVHYADDPAGKDGIFCVRYIQGFIDGVVATDERVTLNVADEFKKEETFAQRAVRTRLGSRLDHYGPSFYAEFCLGAPVPLVDVVNLVIADLQDRQSLTNLTSARDLVYQTLRTHFPCKLIPAEANS